MINNVWEVFVEKIRYVFNCFLGMINIFIIINYFLLINLFFYLNKNFNFMLLIRKMILFLR